MMRTNLTQQRRHTSEHRYSVELQNADKSRFERGKSRLERRWAALLELVPSDAQRILDIGCAEGGFGRMLRQQRDVRYLAGAELAAERAVLAGEVYDEVVVGDVEQVSLPFSPESFDCIVYSEVLEHLRDPWGTLARHVRLLRPGGVVIASVPNVRRYTVVWALLTGRWEYGPTGPIGLAHLRFFTKATFMDLMKRAGLEIVEVRRSGFMRHPLLKLAQLLPFLVKDLLNKGYTCMAKKPRAQATHT